MIDITSYEKLNKDDLITDEQLARISSAEAVRPISLLWELKTLMYCGILLLTTGLGIIIYKNIDSIGHLAIVISIGIAMVICFSYCIKKSPPFTFSKTTSNSALQDYLLLFGCMLMLIFFGYLQFQFNLFGNRWGMATFIPMLILFVSAYYFDHLGVLSMALVNFAAWAGITITPLHMLKRNDFSNESIIYTGLSLGVLFMAIAYLSQAKNIKKHFYFTYKNFGAHLLFISTIAGMFHFGNVYLLWFILLCGISAVQYAIAFKEKSFYFLVITLLYFYFGISYVLMRLLFYSTFSESALYMAFLYFILSGIGFIFLLTRLNKSIKTK